MELDMDLDEHNKEALLVKKGETNDAGVSEKAVWLLRVARELQEPRSLVLGQSLPMDPFPHPAFSCSYHKTRDAP